MKISIKLFFYTYMIMICVLSFAGFQIIKYLYRTELNNAYNDSLEDCKNIYNYVWIEDNLKSDDEKNTVMKTYRKLSLESDIIGEFYLYDYDGWLKESQFKNCVNITEKEILYKVIDRNEKKYIQLTCRTGDKYIILYKDIQYVFDNRDKNYTVLKQIIILISAFTSVVLFVFARYITRPIVELTKGAQRMSNGDYTARIKSNYGEMKSIEAITLGKTLNMLAENTEKHIEELEDAAEKQNRFVGSFTHEIKTPLTSIIGYSDLLRTYALDIEKQHTYREFIYKEGKRLEQLSHNLLQLLVVEKNDFPRMSIHMENFLKDIDNSVRFLSEKYNIKIEFDYEDAICKIESTLLKTTVTNLIDNACKASDEEQIVHVKGEKISNLYRISVIDEGIGIDESEIEKITEPFYMVDKSRSRKQGGAGLGLALCSAIVQVHESRLNINSTLGKGTTIYFDIEICGEVCEDEE